MKGILFILSLFMSCAFFGTVSEPCIAEERFHEAQVASTDKSTTGNKADFNDLAILPVRTASYSGDGNSFAPSLRSTNSGRRVHPSTKSGYRVIRAGKVFDRNNLYAFRAVILQFQSGIRSNSRYIYSICQLLI